MSHPIVLILFAYLLGSVPVGLLLTRFFSDKDIRKEGSGNIGATNVFRVVGWKMGALTLLGDFLKGFLPVAIAGSLSFSNLWIGLVALAAFLGHCYSLYLKFKGGKGVATGGGVFLAMAPPLAVFSIAIWLAVVLITKRSSLGGLTASLSMPVIIGMFHESSVFLLISIIMVVIVFWRHRENIKRLIEGTEGKT